MARKRKTATERRQEWAHADAGEWPKFRAQFDAAKGWKDSVALVDQAPGPDRPGRRFYSNLGFFLQSFMVPNGSNSDERGLYLQLIRRMAEAGELKPGVRGRVESELLRRE